MAATPPTSSAGPSSSAALSEQTTTLLPPPSLDVPSSRPYTGLTMASARTSFTHVDLDASAPPLPSSDGIVQTSAEGTAAHEPNQQVVSSPSPPQTPQTSLTFLLVSGRRRTMSFEPDTTVGRVKELVWNAWPSEWQDERPPAPSYLRVLYLGKILQDDDNLTKLSFPSHTPTSSSSPPSPSTVVHLSIRPYAPPSDDDALKKKGRKRRMLGSSAPSSDIGTDGDEVVARGCCGGCVIC